MPGFTPAKASTSAGLSRASRSRSSAVRSGLAMALSMAGSAASAGADQAGTRMASSELSSILFMGVSLARIMRIRRHDRNLVHRAGYSTERPDPAPDYFRVKEK